MALYTVRSPFSHTAYLGVRDPGTNLCQAGTDKYWHIGPVSRGRGFDIGATSGGSAAPVFARIVNGVGVTAGVYARSSTCGWISRLGRQAALGVSATITSIPQMRLD